MISLDNHRCLHVPLPNFGILYVGFENGEENEKRFKKIAVLKA